jgi:DNA end-binding protein Ku
MRSVKKTCLTFGLVNVAVKLFAATEDHTIHFHQHHGPSCLGGVTTKRVCRECGDSVEYGDIVKGIERDGNLITVNNDEIAALDGEQDSGIEIVLFIRAGEVDTVLFDNTYYLDADKGCEKGYALLRTALVESKRVGIVRFTMRQRTRLGTLRVIDDVLAITTMRWSDEVRGTGELLGAKRVVELSQKEVTLAHALVESMAGEWEPAAWVDAYTQRLGELIDAKAANAELTTAELTTAEHNPSDGLDVSDLLCRLEESLARKTKTAVKSRRRKQPAA